MFSANEAVRSIEANAGRPATPAAAIPSETELGAALESARRELIDVGAAMTRILDSAAADLTRDAVRMLERQSCRIAVVGQIKAGKSSFVNALVRRPGLLPTDINPWTTAVTNLRFRQAGPEGAEAVFSFFSEGAGKLRDLTQRLVPGFKPALLRQQLATLKARATQRLGNQYAGLMGRAHSFAKLDGEMLQQYVCSGVVEPGSPVGRYSDITRSADIYLGGGPFALPATIIDTPGTNDPFLVRDEITRASLDRADITLVLLTAHQPLSDADVSLLRILRGLHKERIIVVINRIDELSDVAGETAEVVGYVRNRLAEEFPGSDIPVIPGSARWGLSALAQSAGADLDPAVFKRALAYCRDAGLLDPNDVLTGKPASEIVKTLHRSALLAASGLAKLHAALDAMIPESRSGYVIREFCRCFMEMAQASLLAARDARASLVHGEAEMADPAQQSLEQLRAEIAALAETIGLVKRMAGDFERQMVEVIARGIVELDAKLQSHVDAHADNERSALVVRLRVGQRMRAWMCDSASLNRDLADEFMLSFSETEQRLSDISATMISGLSDLANLLGPASAVNPAPDLTRKLVAPPNPGALGRRIVLDLDDSWWSQLWKEKPGPEERGDAVESLVRGVYYPVIDELKASFERTIQGYAATRARWSHAVCDTIARALEIRYDQLASGLSRAGDAIDNPQKSRVVSHDHELQSLDLKIAETEALLRRLRTLHGKIDGLPA